jgi:hypothetical protein
MRLIRRTFLGLALLATLSATAALAQEAASQGHSGLGFGVKAGFGISPEQIVVGGQVSLGKTLGIFRVVPNAHFGFGDVTSFDINVDFRNGSSPGQPSGLGGTSMVQRNTGSAATDRRHPGPAHPQPGHQPRGPLRRRQRTRFPAVGDPRILILL